MSRSVRGSKGCGYEYWSKRPGPIYPIGKKSKQICHRIERRKGALCCIRDLKNSVEWAN